VDSVGVAAALLVTTVEALSRWLAHDSPAGLDRHLFNRDAAVILADYLSGETAAPRFHPIGVVHTPFHTTEGMPVQPSRAAGVRGTVEVFPEYEDGLADLDGFSHVVLLCHLHRARPHRLRVVPYLDDRERGLFATRAPSRPNPIGLSVVRLLGVEGSVLRVENVDLLNGTPLLDIKPWVGELGDSGEVRFGWLELARRRERKADRRFGD
jgi:tRNA-Thr(GGU) m(6)t(6)A37 methyltransferase TsaA